MAPAVREPLIHKAPKTKGGDATLGESETLPSKTQKGRAVVGKRRPSFEGSPKEKKGASVRSCRFRACVVPRNFDEDLFDDDDPDNESGNDSFFPSCKFC